MFSVTSSGALTEVPGSPFEVPEGTPEDEGTPAGLAFRPNGDLLAAFGHVITTYSVAASGALTPIGSGVLPERSGNGFLLTRSPGWLAFSPDGSMVAAALGGSKRVYGVAVFSISPSGALSELPGSSYPTPRPAEDIAFSASGLLAVVPGPLSVLVPSSTSASTNWVGALGSAGYDLAGWDGQSDVSYFPDASVSLVKGSRCLWEANTSDLRGLPSPDGLTRNGASYCSFSDSFPPREVQVKLSFHKAYTGDLRVYATAWEGGQGPGGLGAGESITVGNGHVRFSDNADKGVDGYTQGGWGIFPISEPAGASLMITAHGELTVQAEISASSLAAQGHHLRCPS